MMLMWCCRAGWVIPPWSGGWSWPSLPDSLSALRVNLSTMQFHYIFTFKVCYCKLYKLIFQLLTQYLFGTRSSAGSKELKQMFKKKKHKQNSMNDCRCWMFPPASANRTNLATKNPPTACESFTSPQRRWWLIASQVLWILSCRPQSATPTWHC